MRHLDRLCQVYQTRPDRLGYGHDYTPQPTPNDANLALLPLDNEPSAIIDQARARHTLTRAAAWFGCQLGLALWPHDQPTAAVYLEAALAVAGQADDPELADWVVAQRSGSGAGAVGNGAPDAAGMPR